MVTMDAFASAFGFDAKSDGVWTTLGKVTAVNGDTLSVLLGGSATPTECEAYCQASVGDIVFVAITKGRARAIACKGGGAYLPLAGGTITGDLTVEGDVSFDGEATISEQSAWRNALGLGSMATESASDYVSTSVGIGTLYEANKDSINTTANQDAYVQGAKITLPAGKYVIYTQWTFGTTSSAAGSTTVGIGYSSSIWNDSRDRIRQADAWFTSHSTTYICTLAAQSDIYSYGSSSIARSGCSSFIRAIKIA